MHRAIVLLMVAGCALPEVELVETTQSVDEQTEDHGCRGFKLEYDDTVEHTFSIDDNPMVDETCETPPVSGLRQAFYRVEALGAGANTVVDVDPLDEGTFIIEAYDSCPIINSDDHDGDMCTRSSTPGGAVRIDGEATLEVVVVWGDLGRYNIRAFLRTTE